MISGRNQHLSASVRHGATVNRIYDDSPSIPIWLLALAAVAMLGSLYFTFIWVSTEATMGIIQRIFSFHVPAAAAAFWAVFVGGIASLLYVKTRDVRLLRRRVERAERQCEALIRAVHEFT